MGGNCLSLGPSPPSPFPLQDVLQQQDTGFGANCANLPSEGEGTARQDEDNAGKKCQCLFMLDCTLLQYISDTTAPCPSPPPTPWTQMADSGSSQVPVGPEQIVQRKLEQLKQRSEVHSCGRGWAGRGGMEC